MKYIFGPVNSRRLGISLGIDLVPYKVCTLNCVYCECGETTDLMNTPGSYAPLEDVIRELNAFLLNRPKLDVLTFSGSGEPTLNKDIGKVITHIKEKYPEYPVAVLTNGTLLWKDEVRSALHPADIMIPSLDAVSEDVFNRIGRPAKGISAAKTVRGLIDFSREYRGRLIVEVFIVPGVNDSRVELEKIKQVCLEVNPEKVQLNSIDRPGSESWVSPVSEKDMESIAGIFYPLNVEWIGRPAKTQGAISHEEASQLILETIKRRPSTMEDLESALGIKRSELHKIIQKLLHDNIISSQVMERGVFYKAEKPR